MNTTTPLFAKRKSLAHAIASAGLSASQAFAACPGTVSSATASACNLVSSDTVTILTNGSINVTTGDAVSIGVAATSVTINNSGTINADNGTAINISSNATSVTINNSGVISATSGYGVHFEADFAGALTNNAGAVLSGDYGIVVSGTVLSGSTLVNNGSISAAGSGTGGGSHYGVDLQNMLTGASVVNNGSISSTADYVSAASVKGFDVDDGGGNLNFTADSSVTVSATSGSNADARAVSADDNTNTASTLDFNGSISATAIATNASGDAEAYGIEMSDLAGDMTLGQGGNVDVTVNAGTASTAFASGYGIYISSIDDAAGSLTSNGSISVSVTGGNAEVYGIQIDNGLLGTVLVGSSGTVDVSVSGGTATGASAYGLYVSDIDSTTASLTNSGTVTVDADGSSVQAFGIFVLETVNTDALVDNQGTVNVTATATAGNATAGGMYMDSDIDSNAVVSNSGTLNVTATAAANNALAVGIHVDDTIGPNVSIGNDGFINLNANGATATAYGIIADFELQNSATLANSGTIDISLTAVTRANAYGMRVDYSLSANALITNSGSLILDVNLTGSSGCTNNCGLVVGMYNTFSLQDGETLSNSGTITVNAAAPGGLDLFVTGIQLSSVGTAGVLSNSGTITLDAVGAGMVVARGIRVLNSLSAGGSFENTGDVEVTATTTGSGTAASANAYGVDIGFMQAGAVFTNSGTIGASAGGANSNAYSVYVASGSGGTIINDGTISDGVQFLSNPTGLLQNNAELSGDSTLSGDYTQGSAGIYRARVRSPSDIDALTVVGDFDISSNDRVGLSIDPNVVDLPYGSNGSYSFAGVVNYGTITMTGSSIATDSDNPVWDLTAVVAGASGIDYTVSLVSQVTVAAGSTLSNGGLIALRIPDTGGAAPVIVNVEGIIDGQILLGDGVLNLDGGAASVSGDISGDSGSSVNVNDDFTGTSNFTGLTTFTVVSGATLSVGNYSIAATSFNGMGVVNLGNGTVVGNYNNTGTLALAADTVGTIEGNYTQTAGGTLSIDLASNSSYGRLAVSNTADFSAGGTLALNVTGAVTPGVVLTDLVSSGNLVGFDNLTITDDSPLLNFNLQLVGNSIGGQGSDATVVVEQENTIQGIVSDSVYSVGEGAASVLDLLQATGEATDELAILLDIVNGFSTQELDQLSETVAKTLPVLTGVGTNVQLTAIGNTGAAVGSRLSSVRGASSGDNILEDGQFWVKVLGGDTEMEDRNGVDGFDAGSYGILVGIDGMLTEDWLVGAGAVFSRTEIDGSNSFGHKLETDSYQLIIYGQRRFGEDRSFYTNMSLAAGAANTDSTRRIVVSGDGGSLDLEATADYEGIFGRVTGAVGAVYLVGDRATISPELNMAYTYILEDGYTEDGAGNVGLDVFERDEETLIAGFRTRFAYALTDDFSGGQISAHAGVGRDLVGGDGIVSSRYIGSRNIAGGPIFNTPAQELSRTVWYGGVGYELRVNDSLQMMFAYEYEGRDELETEWLAWEARLSF